MGHRQKVELRWGYRRMWYEINRRGQYTQRRRLASVRELSPNMPGRIPKLRRSVAEHPRHLVVLAGDPVVLPVR
jgi:hypothetical protein